MRRFILNHPLLVTLCIHLAPYFFPRRALIRLFAAHSATERTARPPHAPEA